MMRNVRLKIEYDGTNYIGWQTQKHQKNHVRPRNAIQQTIEVALCKILQDEIKLIGSGRTDSGVHALGQIANFKTKSAMPAKQVQRALNSLLPGDIVIKSAKDVPLKFHSRYDATSKTYRYTISDSGNSCVFSRLYQYCLPYKLDIKLMQKAASILIGKKDFKSFQASDKKDRNSVRTIKRLILKRKKNLIEIEIESNGFLYNMVRNIVGTLVEVGRGKIQPEHVKDILFARDRKKAGPTAPAKGLCLVNVRYE